MRQLIGMFIALLAIPAYADHAASKAFTLNTTAVSESGPMPVLYTCDGKDVQPEFTWTNIPLKTQTLAIIFSDPDAPGGTFYHWILYNIPKSTKELAEGMPQPPAGATLGTNSFGKKQYNGPCPPKGTTHTYIFMIYALDTHLSLPAGADAKATLDAMKGHVAGQAKFTLVYSRWMQ